MRPQGRLDHAADQVALEGVVPGLLRRQLETLLDALGGDEAALGGARKQMVEIGVATLNQGVAQTVGNVDVHEGGVEAERRHGHQGLAVVVGRADQLEVGVVGQHVGADAAAGWQKGQAHAGGTQPPLEHPLIELHQLQLTSLTRLAVPGLQGGETVDQLLHLAGRAQHADLGPAIGDHGQILEIAAQDLAHHGHGLAPGAPAAEADGHAIFELADCLGRRQLLVHCSPPC